jgi:hypothetical protein
MKEKINTNTTENKTLLELLEATKDLPEYQFGSRMDRDDVLREIQISRHYSDRMNRGLTWSYGRNIDSETCLTKTLLHYNKVREIEEKYQKGIKRYPEIRSLPEIPDNKDKLRLYVKKMKKLLYKAAEEAFIAEKWIIASELPESGKIAGKFKRLRYYYIDRAPWECPNPGG